MLDLMLPEGIVWDRLVLRRSTHGKRVLHEEVSGLVVDMVFRVAVDVLYLGQGVWQRRDRSERK